MKKKKKSIRLSERKSGFKSRGWIISNGGISYFKLPSKLSDESSLTPVQNSIKGDFVHQPNE